MESGNEKILKDVKKPGTVASFLRAAEIFRKHPKIMTSVFLIIGFPNETVSMILDTIRVARQMDCDWYNLAVLQPLPNTPIYYSMIAQGLIQEASNKNYLPHAGAKASAFNFGVNAERRKRLAAPTAEEAFAAFDLNAVPTAAQVEDIWLYMSYYLNLERLHREYRIEKLELEEKKLRFECMVKEPENCLAHYFYNLIVRRLHGNADPTRLDNLAKRLSLSEDYQARFAAFGLNIDDLRTPEPAVRAQTERVGA
jgi:radical SAM superfamily enzyme YgiQ (UPF0313 family)